MATREELLEDIFAGLGGGVEVAGGIGVSIVTLAEVPASLPVWIVADGADADESGADALAGRVKYSKSRKMDR